MISLNSSFDFSLLSYFYLIVYNFSLFLFFSTFLSFNFESHATLNVLEKVNMRPLPLLILSTILISMAGVPPSIGFISKLLIFLALLESPLFTLAALLFPLLMISLYFYIQNIRFLFTQTSSSFIIEFPILPPQPLNVLYSVMGLIVILFGFFIFEDIWLLVLWLFF